MAQAAWQPQTFGERMMVLRKRLGLHQTDIARWLEEYDLGGDATLVSMWESGKRTPNLLQALVIAAGLGVSPSELGIDSESYRAMRLLEGFGLKPNQKNQQVRWIGDRPSYLRLLPPPLN